MFLKSYTWVLNTSQKNGPGYSIRPLKLARMGRRNRLSKRGKIKGKRRGRLRKEKDEEEERER